ncbi:hypothetical protein [Nocardia salmonicida]|uniref:hypothetical protein n=1 Tax=Nocardia salmonicida TaxID=53431 RepID=UPI0034419D09
MIEAIIALTEGARVSSIALIGFGLDSVIEVSSAAAVAWQFVGTIECSASPPYLTRGRDG